MAAQKSRRVFLTVEVETDLPLATLRSIRHISFDDQHQGEAFVISAAGMTHGQVVQVQANVASPKLKGRRTPR